MALRPGEMINRALDCTVKSKPWLTIVVPEEIRVEALEADTASNAQTDAEDTEDEDTDSDLEDLQQDIAKRDASVRAFLLSYRRDGEAEIGGSISHAPTRLTRGPGRARGGARGPRKAAKPRGDIKARLSKVNQAFLGGDYQLALDLVSEVIRINAETHQAWTALSSIFREQGELPKSLSAMVYAAHLRPKDAVAWMRCAWFALEIADGEDEVANLHTARLCYSAAIRADRNNLEARLGKAKVCHHQGHLSAAAAEYAFVLKHRPRDLDLVRKLAEICIDNKHVETAVPLAITAYRQYLDLDVEKAPRNAPKETWHDVGIYVELFASIGRYQEAIRELKRLSRWLLGRSIEIYWDDVQIDDREWDLGNERRLQVPEFATEVYDSLEYGSGLHLDFRARLAIYRMKLGDVEEAFVSEHGTLYNIRCVY